MLARTIARHESAGACGPALIATRWGDDTAYAVTDAALQSAVSLGDRGGVLLTYEALVERFVGWSPATRGKETVSSYQYSRAALLTPASLAAAAIESALAGGVHVLTHLSSTWASRAAALERFGFGPQGWTPTPDTGAYATPASVAAFISDLSGWLRSNERDAGSELAISTVDGTGSEAKGMRFHAAFATCLWQRVATTAAWSVGQPCAVNGAVPELLKPYVVRETFETSFRFYVALLGAGVAVISPTPAILDDFRSTPKRPFTVVTRSSSAAPFITDKALAAASRRKH